MRAACRVHGCGAQSWSVFRTTLSYLFPLSSQHKARKYSIRVYVECQGIPRCCLLYCPWHSSEPLTRGSRCVTSSHTGSPHLTPWPSAYTRRMFYVGMTNSRSFKPRPGLRAAANRRYRSTRRSTQGDEQLARHTAHRWSFTAYESCIIRTSCSTTITMAFGVMMASPQWFAYITPRPWRTCTLKQHREYG